MLHAPYLQHYLKVYVRPQKFQIMKFYIIIIFRQFKRKCRINAILYLYPEFLNHYSILYMSKLKCNYPRAVKLIFVCYKIRFIKWEQTIVISFSRRPLSNTTKVNYQLTDNAAIVILIQHTLPVFKSINVHFW